MKDLLLMTGLLLTTALYTYGQESDGFWTLEGTISHARQHNLKVQQGALNVRASNYLLSQSKLSQLPSVSFNSAAGRSIGTSIDPTTNVFTTQGFNYLTFSGNANLLIFGWFQQRNNIIRNKASLTAAQYDLQQNKDEVTWTVTTAFLRVLLNWEQLKVNEAQIEITKAQLGKVVKFAKAGAMPDLSVSQMQARLSSDSTQYIQSLSAINAAIVDMRTLLNISQSEPFNVKPPDADQLAAVNMNLLNPEQIYEIAEERMGNIKSASYRITAAKHGLKSTKAALLPQLSLNAQFITAYSNRNRRFDLLGYQSTQVSDYYVQDGTSTLPLYQVTPVYNASPISLGQQLQNNYRTLATVNLTLPVFSGWAASYSVRQARINLEQQELNQQEAKLLLRENVYKAYNDARNSIQTYQAAKRAVNAANTSLGFAQTRQNVGLTSVSDYLAILNTAYIAQSELLAAKYDMFFKIKLVDFYMGKDLKL